LLVLFENFLIIVAEKLAEANKLVDTLAQKLEQSEMARKKADLDASQAKAEAEEATAKAAGVEDLQRRLADAETALNEHKASQAAREKAITKRLTSQNRRFVGNFIVPFYHFLFQY
jgi:putative NADPH-quinone reductase